MMSNKKFFVKKLYSKTIFAALGLIFSQFSSGQIAAHPDLKKLVNAVIPLRSDGKINIPSEIKHIKLDIGLSYSAPMAQYWLTHESDLFVFGFEPYPEHISSILNGAVKHNAGHGEPLEKKFIGKQFFLIPIALGISTKKLIKFFVTKDTGCSSLYSPKIIALDHIIEVPIFSLADFFELFPFDTHPLIEYIKIDAQGSDLDIVKSGGSYLAKHVIYLTLEVENDHYKNTQNSAEAISRYMQSIGFVQYVTGQTSDPTYLNTRFTEYVKTHSIKIYQRG